MKQWLIVWCLLVSSTTVVAHDMFLVIDDHFVATDSPVTVSLYNGTFDTSENTIDRDRMIDVSVVNGNGQLHNPRSDRWREEGNVTLLDLQTGSAGTYVVGVSTSANMIELSAEDFNDYLQHDGILDVLDERRQEGTSNEGAREKYSKHVKTILQVGKTATEAFSRRLGYPVEIVPLANPATLTRGETLQFLVLADGEPVEGQLVYASFAGFESQGPESGQREAIKTRTDVSGVGRIEISRPGRWYLRLIRMIPTAEDGIDYESKWATLTFEVR